MHIGLPAVSWKRTSVNYKTMCSWFMKKSVVYDYLIDDGATREHGELDVSVFDQVKVSGVS